jgi:ketosteroid isomerase-like protein
MKHLLIMTIVLVALVLLGLDQVTGKKAAIVGNADAPPVSRDLYKEIERMDGVLSAAFNTQDLDGLKALFTEDLEFYQDNEGLALYPQTMKDFEGMFAQGNKIRRELVKGSLEVYPVKNYGAIEIGVHRFCHVEKGKDECGTFKFVHLWQNNGGGWKISRVISYAH